MPLLPCSLPCLVPAPRLFPYTTLFRSPGAGRSRRERTGERNTGRNASAITTAPTHNVPLTPTSSPSTPDRAAPTASAPVSRNRSEEHTSELQSPCNLVCRLLLEKKKII